ncbi:MAG: hypothetical protein QOF63_3354 [Thermoanaerobaculia bacterium]|jgi:hypothetical protein|nr:hypothetical protein [Thermoanaerobaculia bacterium]
MSDFETERVGDIYVGLSTDRIVTARHALLTLMALSTLRQGVALCVDRHASILSGVEPNRPLSFWVRKGLARLDRAGWPSLEEALIAQANLQRGLARGGISDALMRQPEFDLVFGEMSQGSLRTRMREFNAVVSGALLRVLRTLPAVVSGRYDGFRRAADEVSSLARSSTDRSTGRGAMIAGAAVIQNVAQSLETREVAVPFGPEDDDRPRPLLSPRR